MSGQILWGRFAFFSALIIGGGYGIMRWATPSEQQFYDKLSPELKRKVDSVKAQREQGASMKATLADAGAQDKIVWGDQLDPASQAKGGRKV